MKTINNSSSEEAWIYFSEELYKLGFVLNIIIDYNSFKKRFNFIKDLNFGLIKRDNMPIVSYKKTNELQNFIETLSESSVKKLQNSLEINNEKLNLDFDLKNFIKNEIPYIYFNRAIDKDDKIKTSIKNKSAKNLKPIQNELFLEKVIDNIIKYGLPSKNNFITKRTLVISKNNYILDVHHR